MRITDIAITRSLAHQDAWMFMIEINDNKFTGYFNDFGGFITMVTECAKFMAVRAGKLRPKDAGFTRPVAPGTNDGKLLPGDKVQ